MTHDQIQIICKAVNLGDPISAKTLDKNKISILHAAKLASLLAKIHLLNVSVPGITKPSYDTYSSNALIMDLIEKSVEASVPFADKLQQSKSMILDANEKYQKAMSLLEQSLIVSHTDLDPKSVSIILASLVTVYDGD